MQLGVLIPGRRNAAALATGTCGHFALRPGRRGALGRIHLCAQTSGQATVCRLSGQPPQGTRSTGSKKAAIELKRSWTGQGLVRENDVSPIVRRVEAVDRKNQIRAVSEDSIPAG